MTEEEAIKILKDWKITFEEEEYLDMIAHNEKDIKAFELILNLIEKLQTENKNLKQIEKEHQEENGKLRQYIKELEEKVEKYRGRWED